MLPRTRKSSARFIALVAAILLPIVLFAACGGDDPATSTPAATEAQTETQVTAPADTPVPANTPEPTSIPEETPEPVPADTPEPAPEDTPEPTHTPEPTATVEPTTAPATPEPTEEQPAATEEPTPTEAPPALTELCEGTEGGEVGNCAPELQGIQEWINSEPLTMESLRGRVVLIDFWTYSCINCIRTIPFLQTWHERYADQGLVILGVHTPEFEFEKVYDNVVEATEEMGVAWPVVQDNDFTVWGSYNNRFWPAKYLIDKTGEIRYRHFGEGRYAETEAKIRELLAEVGAETDSLALPLPDDQQIDPAYLTTDSKRTPELFAGWRFTSIQGRGGIGQPEIYMEAARTSFQAGDQAGVVAEFEQPEKLSPNVIYFHGPWSIGPESAVHARETESYIDAIVLHYSARSVNAVLTSESGEPYRVVVTVNNEYLTDDNKGEDIIIGENGESYLIVSSPKAYRIIEHPEWQERQILAMSSLSNDFGLFSFTFGTYEDGF